MIDICGCRYNGAISACDRGLQGRRAVALLGDMRRAGISPEAASFSSAISACAKEGNLHASLQLWQEMHRCV